MNKINDLKCFIENCKTQLRELRKTGTREQQLACFKRLEAMYTVLNAELATNNITPFENYLIG